MVKKTTNPTPLVSVVILNWNGTEDTLKCLESVKSLDYKNIETLVVDNGSVEDISSLENIKWITLIRNKRNLGFAGGEISALKHAKGEFLFLLNNDAIVKSNAVSEAMSTFSSDNIIAAVGGKSYPLHDNEHESINYYSYQYINPITAEVHTYTKDDNATVDTPTVSGSAVLIKKECLKKCGYFDNRFFAYYEETDLFARLARCGFKIKYNPNVVIWHKDGASTANKRFMYYYLMLKNQFLFAYKNFDSTNIRHFKKTYWRNFRRSIWIVLKDKNNAETVHKARIRSTTWNIVHFPKTFIDRRINISINKDFNYTDKLYKQPLHVTVIIDGKENSVDENKKAIEKILKSPVKPSEILIITKSHISTLPKHSRLIDIREIEDKGLFDVSSIAYGFMASNTDVLIPTSTNTVLQATETGISRTIKACHDYVTANESSLVFATETYRNDLYFTNSRVNLSAIRKSDLVSFMTNRDELYDIDDHTLSEFINWAIMDCRSIDKITKNDSVSYSLLVKQSAYPILHNPPRWYVKKIIHKLHLARILSKLAKLIKKVDRNTGTLSNNTQTRAHAPTYDTTLNAIVNTPVIINTRDRFDPLVRLVNWLEKDNFTKIVFTDNNSTYPELINYLSKTSFQVIPLGRNGMHKSPWESFAVRFTAKNKPYIVTDPDILPNGDASSSETIKKLYATLNRHPSTKKVGVALAIDDLPEHYSMRDAVLEWESRFWNTNILVDKDLYEADVDTTFALYRQNTWWHLAPSLRLAGKYTMHHEPWYQDLDNPTDDMLYYRLRASNDVSTWVKGKLPKHHLKALKKEGML